LSVVVVPANHESVPCRTKVGPALQWDARANDYARLSILANPTNKHH
jgi:hypothetical protein